jgi:hypothetical protein
LERRHPDGKIALQSKTILLFADPKETFPFSVFQTPADKDAGAPG